MRILPAILVSAILCGAASTATAQVAQTAQTPQTVQTSQTPQTHLPVPISPYTPFQPLWFNSYLPTFVPFDYSSRKLQLKPYASISTGFVFWNGGGISYLSAPAGLMLIRPLTNNVAAFSNISVAPTVWSPMYHDPALRSSGYGLGLSTRVEGGLIYTNDARTFSISGSVSVERGSYPAYYPATHHPNTYPKSY